MRNETVSQPRSITLRVRRRDGSASQRTLTLVTSSDGLEIIAAHGIPGKSGYESVGLCFDADDADEIRAFLLSASWNGLGSWGGSKGLTTERNRHE